MADIELVIKIDEGTYNNFVRNEYFRVDVIAMHTSLANGTPLPKGHGRIVDESKISKGTWNGKYLECNAPTIIEADKE